MKKNIIIILVLFVSNSSFAQLSDLCGIWLGYNYQCYTVSSDGSLNFYTKTEVILIEHNGDFTVATKIIGDDCVTDGQITWQGNYDQNPFPVTFTLGDPSSPGSVTAGGSITVIDSDHIELSVGVKFIKATCHQIDSLNLNLVTLNIGCIDCSFDATIEMPNVFTPNYDGINDLFIPIRYKNIAEANMKIYNRWGNLVYTSDQVINGWNGKIKNKECPDGIYFWIVNYSDKNSYSNSIRGAVTLMR